MMCDTTRTHDCVRCDYRTDEPYPSDREGQWSSYCSLTGYPCESTYRDGGGVVTVEYDSLVKS